MPLEAKKNVPERIIFFIDLTSEMDSLEFNRGKATKYTRLDLVKSALKSFVQLKQKMNPEHQYGICIMTESSSWYCDPTEDTSIFLSKLNNLSTAQEFNSFNVSSIFDLMNARYPDIITTRAQDPSHIYRVIFIYSRSNVLPLFSTKELANKFLDSPVFFFDCLYLHQKPTKDNRPQEVYDKITEIEGQHKNCYFFENSTSARKFFSSCCRTDSSSPSKTRSS